MEQPQVQPATTSAVAVQSDFRRLRNVKVGNVVGQTSQERRVNCVVDKHSLELLEDKRQGVSSVDVSRLASDKNQVMDELLNQDQIPADLRDANGGVVPRQGAGRPDAGLRRAAHRPLRAGSEPARRVRSRIDGIPFPPCRAFRRCIQDAHDHRGGGVSRARRHGGVRSPYRFQPLRCAACRLCGRHLCLSRRARDGRPPLRRASRQVCHPRTGEDLRCFWHAGDSSTFRQLCLDAYQMIVINYSSDETLVP